MSKIYCSLFVVFPGVLFCAFPAWAGKGNHFGHGHDTAKYISRSTDTGIIPVLTIDSTNADTNVHPDRKQGAASRALQRVNGVAGEHGEVGRTNARHDEHR